MTQKELKQQIVVTFKFKLEMVRKNLVICEHEAHDATRRLDAARLEVLEAEQALRLVETMMWEGIDGA